MENRPKIGLALGSGSARGLAHIGVLQVLRENDIPIDLVAGCSIGAMVGGVYAAGVDMKMLGKMVENIDTKMFFDISYPRMGFIAGEKIKKLLSLLTKNKNFEDLDIPFYAVATDLVSGQRVIINEGSVTEAIRASISIPGVFQPVKKEGMVLVDGAVTDRLPIEVAKSKGSDIIIAVEVNYTHNKETKINGILDVLMTSLDIMQKVQFDFAEPQADILLKPKVGHFAPQDFASVKQLIALGRAETEPRVAEIKKMLNTRPSSLRGKN
ncbi:MAG: patatin-like phospholipase family protein [Syntrophomonadaceae bacterium]|jgi:NTE family protein|nr:patatin-like phospholipase family protein [Syntrophomonadaceae bacterium]